MYKIAICIPTYNRSEKVFKLVNNLLSKKFDWLQIVVSDNCSTDDTVLKLKQIVDSRLSIYTNTKNEGAIANYLNAIVNSDAVYSVFLTDKDDVNIDHLAFVANELEKYKPVAGYIKYSARSREKTRIAPRFLKLFVAGYRCIHPSGYFFTSISLKKRLHDQALRDSLLDTSFPFEFLLTSCSGDGDIAILHIPLITQESPDEYRAIKSHTYSSTKGNLYFTPDNRRTTFSRFVDDIDQNCTSRLDARLTKIRLLYWSTSVSTLGYAKIISDESFREHYLLSEQETTLRDIAETMYRYFSAIDEMRTDRRLLKLLFIPICAATFIKFMLWRSLVNHALNGS